MAFTGSFICTSFKLQLLNGTHNLFTAGDTFRIALYSSSASLSAATTVYGGTVGVTPDTNEVTGTGYTAGGIALTNVDPLSSGTTAYAQWATPTFTTVTLTARGALIFNTSKSNKAVCVIDFGSDKVKAAANLVVTMPTFDATNALLRFA